MKTSDRVIVVRCTDVAHPRRTVYVAQFCGHEDGTWFEMPAQSVKGGGGGSRVSQQHFDGDSPIQWFNRTEPLPKGIRLRSRHPLRCSLCDLSFPTRHEKLEPVLERLYRAGITFVELASVPAIVASSK